MHFGEYELSPSLIGLSPLSTAHPKTFQRLPVRSSIPCYRNFNLIASFNFGVYALEDYSTVLDGTDALDIEWELGAKLSDISQRTIVQRVYIDIDTNGELMTPTLILDDTTIDLPTFIANGRQLIEYSVNRTCRLVGLRVTGQVSNIINLYAVEMDLAFGVSHTINESVSPGRG